MVQQAGIHNKLFIFCFKLYLGRFYVYVNVDVYVYVYVRRQFQLFTLALQRLLIKS